MFAELLIHPLTNVKKEERFKFNGVYETICAVTLRFSLRALFIFYL